MAIKNLAASMLTRFPCLFDREIFFVSVGFKSAKIQQEHLLINLKSQSATSSLDEYAHGGRRKLPFAFTEQGIAMLSSVLRSEIAVQVSIRIMDTFVEMRKYMSNASLLYEKMNAMEIRQIAMEEKTERRFERVFDYIESHKQGGQNFFRWTDFCL